MENENKKAKSEAAVAKAKSLPITGKVTLEVNNNGNEYISAIMSNPFPEEPELGDFRLTFVNVDKRNNWGNPIEDRAGEKREGGFNYFAKKALATGEDISFNGAITYRRFETKKGNFDYISIDINSPFPQVVSEGKPLRAYLKKVDNLLAFEYFAKERLELTLDNDN